VIIDEVASNLEDPRAQVFRIREAIHVSMDAHECFLKQIVGRVVVRNAPADELPQVGAET
jgi:hypothetical protein